jgi:hypothetical protein
VALTWDAGCDWAAGAGEQTYRQAEDTRRRCGECKTQERDGRPCTQDYVNPEETHNLDNQGGTVSSSVLREDTLKLLLLRRVRPESLVSSRANLGMAGYGARLEGMACVPADVWQNIVHI